MKRWVVGMAIVVMGVGGGALPDARAAILINEVLADPAGDADGDGVVHSTKDEFVELVNTDAGQVSLAGWTLSDAVQVRRTLDATAVISGRGFWVTFGSLGLNNSGDTVTLRDAAALPVDAFTFGPEGGQDTSLTRSPDGEGAFVLHTTVGGIFSPGTTIGGLASLPPLPQPEPEPELPPLPIPDDLPGGPVVPEPSSLWLLGAGLLWIRRTRWLT